MSRRCGGELRRRQQVVAVTYLLPLWGVFWGLIAGEAIGFATYVGIAITVGGLILLNLPPRRRAQPGQ